MAKIDKLFQTLRIEMEEQKFGPSPDIGICSNCGGRFGPDEYELEWESEGWEYPSYQVAVCPVCEDGGCIDDWDFSPEQQKKYKEWKEK